MKVRLNLILLITAALGFVFMFSGCSKDEEPRLSIPVEVTVSFPAEFNTFATHTVEIFSIPNLLQSRLAQNGMTIDQITSIVAGRGQIVAVSPNVQYQLFNNVVVNVSSVDNDNLNEMYYNDLIEFDHTGNLELFSSISELDEIMLDGVFDLEIKYNLRQSLLTTTVHSLRFNLLIYD